MSAFRPVFWFFIGVAIVAVPMFSLAGEMPVPIAGVSANAAGELIHTSRAGISSVIYPALQTTTPLSISLPPAGGMVQPGRQLMVIPTTISPNAARVASAVVGLARLSGPVGLGLTLLPILCTETGLCASSTNPNILVKNAPGDYWKDVPHFGQQQFPTMQAICDARAPGAGVALYVEGNMCLGVPAPHYLYATGTIYHDGPVVSSAPTDPDYSAAVVQLAAATSRLAEVVNGLNNLGQPIPIDKPVLSPVSATTPAETTVNRDSAGNIVNSTTTTTTTTIAPVTNTSTTNTVNVTQVTNTTTTGPTGAVTSTTQKSAEPPKPDDPEIGFDDVPDVNLERQELPLNMAAPSSWGEGSCPPDPSVSVMGHPVAVPVHVVCDYMVGVRGAVIALFALISAYIVIGVKFEG